MDVRTAARQRRSIRRYSDRPITEETLTELIREARHAPSSSNTQPWRILAVRDAEKRSQLAAASFGNKQIEAAPVNLVVYSDMQDTLATLEETVHPGMASRREEVANNVRGMFANRTPEQQEEWAAGQTYIFIGYLLLVAHQLGLGTSPMLGFDPAKVKAIFGLPEHVRIPAVVAMGYPAEPGFPHHRHSVERILRVV